MNKLRQVFTVGVFDIVGLEKFNDFFRFRFEEIDPVSHVWRLVVGD